MSRVSRLEPPLTDNAHLGGGSERVASRPYGPPVERHGL